MQLQWGHTQRIYARGEPESRANIVASDRAGDVIGGDVAPPSTQPNASAAALDAARRFSCSLPRTLYICIEMVRSDGAMSQGGRESAPMALGNRIAWYSAQRSSKRST